MTENKVNLLQVTSTSAGADEITSNSTAMSSTTADVFVKRTPIKLNHTDSAENGMVQKDSVEHAWEDEAIIQSCLKRSHLRLNNSTVSLSNYPLNEDERRLAKSKGIRLWNNLFRYLSNTSFHGFPHIVGSKRSYSRVTFWFIAFLIALSLMLWAVISVTIQYAEKNTVLFMKRHFNERLRFPAVTICNKNLYRKSVAINAGIDVNDSDIILLTFLNQVLSDPLFAGIFNSTSFAIQYEHLFNTSNSVFYFNSSGHQINDMLFNCQYSRRICTPQDFIQRTSSSGNCYTFNSGEGSQSVLYSSNGGYSFGLQLILNAEQYEYFLADSDIVGFNVFIHEQDHFPYYGGVNSFSISVGQSTQVSLRKVQYKLQTPAGGGQCGNDIILKYFKSYSRESCIVECIMDLVVATCNCKAQGMPGPAHVCKLRDFCMQKTVAQSFNQEDCNCPVSCDMTVYEKTLSYAKFPADHITLLLNNSDILSRCRLPKFIVSTTSDADNGGMKFILNNNFTESFLSNNFAKVFIYYDELVSTTMEENLEYSTFQFIADFGGHIGLFTGAGFLTLFEIIDLCFSMIRRPTDD